MIVGIDLHNIRDGGGVNYIRNLLAVADPARDGFEAVHLFASPENLTNFPDRPFVVKHPLPALSGRLFSRVRCAFGTLPRVAREAGCDILYAPGGIAFGQFRPYATISRNMMPFRKDLWSLYPEGSAERMRLRVLHRLNARTFTKADGMIFLTEGARSAIEPYMRGRPQRTAVIAHGVNRERFMPAARTREVRRDGPIRLVYPSRFEPYKHQIEVIEAVSLLRAEFPGITIDLSGPVNAAYLAKFEAARARIDPDGAFVRYLGQVDNAALPQLYSDSDLLVFASSCENLPNILIEAMSCGIPIVSADAPPMPEVVGDAALLFDPTDPASIADAVRRALSDPQAMRDRAARGLERAAHYSWERCATQTFGFLAQAAGRSITKEGN